MNKKNFINIEQLEWVCADCGIKWGKRDKTGTSATWHIGTCGVCGHEKAVTEPRDFRYLKEGWENEQN
jgi:hypothetical protein